MQVRNWSALVRVRFAWPAEERPGVVDILGSLAEAAGAVAAYDASPEDVAEVLVCVPLGQPYDDGLGEGTWSVPFVASGEGGKP